MKKNQQSLIIAVGLGNPGTAHKDTYHNVGIRAIRALTALYKERYPDIHCKNVVKPFFSGTLCGKLAFLESDTYMNESGKAVAAALTTYHAPPDKILVIHDDADLTLGNYKFSFGRGAAGHNGAASAIQALGTKNFWRLRIGIRSAPGKAGVFVLKSIQSKDRAPLVRCYSRASKKLIENENPSGPVLTSERGSVTSAK